MLPPEYRLPDSPICRMSVAASVSLKRVDETELSALVERTVAAPRRREEEKRAAAAAFIAKAVADLKRTTASNQTDATPEPPRVLAPVPGGGGGLANRLGGLYNAVVGAGAPVLLTTTLRPAPPAPPLPVPRETQAPIRRPLRPTTSTPPPTTEVREAPAPSPYYRDEEAGYGTLEPGWEVNSLSPPPPSYYRKKRRADAPTQGESAVVVGRNDTTNASDATTTADSSSVAALFSFATSRAPTSLRGRTATTRRTQYEWGECLFFTSRVAKARLTVFYVFNSGRRHRPQQRVRGQGQSLDAGQGDDARSSRPPPTPSSARSRVDDHGQVSPVGGRGPRPRAPASSSADRQRSPPAFGGDAATTPSASFGRARRRRVLAPPSQKSDGPAPAHRL